MIIFLIIFALLAGMALPTQFSVNAQLRSVVHSPLIASTISFIVGAIVLLLISLFGRGMSVNKEWLTAPWWVWTGGLLGAFYVVASIVLIPRLGATATVAYILAGQMVASTLIDHFGLIGVQMHSLSIPRVIGILLIIFGVIIIQKF
ncbi:DMT family transporter [Priestia megaterium]|uniref:DMT family transporter n=1 Tax=Priestia megaterium TaxID=1404 RepID=UPI002E215D27|nr:DMT family transporter [Priestia megaterium]MED4268445.1 DMT family transporter [Priestia megaterium]MED4279302.1 DMT family transporter [Priestia megaterium]MED4319578.1 DMT family transporter [Priestia megaterium]